jgi:hypothetical protein
VRRDRRAKVAKSCGHVLGVGNLILLIFGQPTTVTLSVTVVLAPFTLAMALKLTVFLACSCVSLALGDCQDRAELLACAIGGAQPPGEGEQYREAMIAEIRDDLAAEKISAIVADLLINAPRTILRAWVRVLVSLWERARKAVSPSTGRSRS